MGKAYQCQVFLADGQQKTLSGAPLGVVKRLMQQADVAGVLIVRDDFPADLVSFKHRMSLARMDWVDQSQAKSDLLALID